MGDPRRSSLGKSAMSSVRPEKCEPLESFWDGTPSCNTSKSKSKSRVAAGVTAVEAVSAVSWIEVAGRGAGGPMAVRALVVCCASQSLTNSKSSSIVTQGLFGPGLCHLDSSGYFLFS